MLTESSPALSASCLGMTSSALAKAETTNCWLPLIVFECSLIILDNSISIDPAPPRILEAFIALLTTMIESLSERLASWMNSSAPPLRMIVADWV